MARALRLELTKLVPVLEQLLETAPKDGSRGARPGTRGTAVQYVGRRGMVVNRGVGTCLRRGGFYQISCSGHGKYNFERP